MRADALSVGIELEGKQMSTLIKRNTAIPCRKTRTYTTVADYQTDIDVVIYEGERPVRERKVFLSLFGSSPFSSSFFSLSNE